ncbi:MAG: TolC family protein [Epsilonproteobacteria bacterium]|nr:MAG: TolC family protein [Campylobacterota bacterium]
MKRLIKLSTILALTLNLNATDTYTVDDLILKSIENSPDIKISAYNYESSKSRYDQAFSGYLPTVDLRLSMGTGEASDNAGFGGEMVENETSFAGISAKQLIYDFGKTGGNSDSFKFESEAYSSEHAQFISNKKRDIKSAYFQVLQDISLIEVQKENVKLSEIQLYRAEKYFTAGIRTRIDISDAKVNLLQAKLALKNAEYDLKLAYTSLDKVVGFKEIKTDYVVYSQKLDFDNLYSSLSAYKLTLEESVKFAYENRDELKKQQSQIESVKAQSTKASSDYYPDIYANGSYTKQKSDKLKTALAQEQWKVSANLDWNIYRGGATNAATQEKEIEVHKSEADLIYSKLSIKTETTQAYLNVNRTKDSVELSQSLVEVSNEKFDQADKRYEHGLSDYIELQEARQGYIDAKASLVVDYYNYYTAIATLDNAIGK